MTVPRDVPSSDARRPRADPYSRRALILLYHRAMELPTDPQLLCVAPPRFAEHMEILRRRWQVLSLSQLVRAMKHDAIPPRSVAVTFDDGYADNLLNARPILESRDVPATVFVVSGAVGSRREFWWDDLDRIFLQPGTLPATLHLTIAGVPREWSLGDSASCDAATWARFRAWNVLDKTAPTPRHAIYCELCTLVRPLPTAERARVLNDLSNWAGVTAAGREAHRSLTADELGRLADSGLIEIGAHTVTHPVLSAFSSADSLEPFSSLKATCSASPVAGGVSECHAPSGLLQRSNIDAQRRTAAAEICDSKSAMEAILGRPVTSFSYPYGQRSDYTAKTVDLVRQAGFESACSNFRGAVRANTDPFQLPRMIVRDWNGDSFAQRLEQWWSDA